MIAGKEAERQAELKRNCAAVRGAAMMCNCKLDASYSQGDFDDYLTACGADGYPDFRQLAAAKGFTEQHMVDAALAQMKRQLEAYRGRVQIEEF